MRTPRVFKSLADLPADAWAMAASLPGRAVRASRAVAAAGRKSQRALVGMYGNAKSALRFTQPWSRGGLNE